MSAICIFFGNNKNFKNALKILRWNFQLFYHGGPKRVEFPIGIIDYGSQCCTECFYHNGLGQGLLEKWTKHAIQLGKTPRAPLMVWLIISLKTSQLQGFLGSPEVSLKSLTKLKINGLLQQSQNKA